MPALDRKIVALTEGKLTTDGPGSFTGYASLFGQLDSQGDVVLKGAYAATLPQFLERGFIAWSHDWADPVATISTAQEDDRGLLLTADFHSDPASQRARTIAQERLARGKFMGLSIGYTIPEGGADFAEGVRLLKAIDLYETSLVTVPALRDAGVTAAKQGAADTKAAVGAHHTKTSEGAWDGPANTARVLTDQPASYFRAIYAWQDPAAADARLKTAWRFIHHEVAADGTPGPANMKACATLIGVLNGGRGVDVGSQPWAKDREAIHAHIAAHMQDGGMEPPPLKNLVVDAEVGDAWVLDALKATRAHLVDLKAGRRNSASDTALMQECMDHLAAMQDTLRQLMDTPEQADSGKAAVRSEWLRYQQFRAMRLGVRA